MDGFWNIIEGWTPMGQGIFLLLVFWALLGMVKIAVFYATTAVRGWPPEHVRLPGETDSDEM